MKATICSHQANLKGQIHFSAPRPLSPRPSLKPHTLSKCNITLFTPQMKYFHQTTDHLLLSSPWFLPLLLQSLLSCASPFTETRFCPSNTERWPQQRKIKVLSKMNPLLFFNDPIELCGGLLFCWDVAVYLHFFFFFSIFLSKYSTLFSV